MGFKDPDQTVHQRESVHHATKTRTLITALCDREFKFERTKARVLFVN